MRDWRSSCRKRRLSIPRRVESYAMVAIIPVMVAMLTVFASVVHSQPSVNVPAVNAAYVHIVKYWGNSTQNNTYCMGGGIGQHSKIDPLLISTVCIPQHGEIGSHMYYIMDKNIRGTVSYGCTDDTCSNCLVNDTPYNTCQPFGPRKDANQSISIEINENFLPKNVSLSRPNGVTMAWYSDCDDSALLSHVDGLGQLTTVPNCTEISDGLYHSLHHIPNGGVSTIAGSMWCSSSDCEPDNCLLTLNKMAVGQSYYNSNGCFLSYDSQKFGPRLIQQPICQCSADRVYVNLYSNEDEEKANSNCELGLPFETAIISSIQEGYSTLSHDPAELDIDRTLMLELDVDTSTTVVNYYGAPCFEEGNCSEAITSAAFGGCYPTPLTGGSTVFYKPDNICFGAPTISRNAGGVAVFRYYGSPNCPDDLTNANPDAIIEIRGYPSATGQCEWDGTSGNTVRKSYKLSYNQTENSYNMSFGCEDNSTCSDCTVDVVNISSGTCQATSFGSIKIVAVSELLVCRAKPPATGPPGPKPPGPPNPNDTTQSPDRTPLSSNDPVLIIGSVGGVLFLGMVIAGFIYYMRRKSRDKYESLLGNTRRKPKPYKRPQDRNKAGSYTDETYYDGI